MGGCWAFNRTCQTDMSIGRVKTDVCRTDAGVCVCECVCAEKNRWSHHETVFPAGKFGGDNVETENSDIRMIYLHDILVQSHDTWAYSPLGGLPRL